MKTRRTAITGQKVSEAVCKKMDEIKNSACHAGAYGRYIDQFGDKAMKTNDLIRMTKRMKGTGIAQFQPNTTIADDGGAITVETARVTGTGVAKTGNHWFTYVPCNRPDSVRCSAGSHHGNEDGYLSSTEWGLQELEIIGHEEPKSRILNQSQGLYKNPGYDLVNI